MNKAKYSSDITKLATVEQAKDRYKLSRNALVKIAEDAKALKKIGRSVRIDVGILDAYIDKL